MLSYETMLTNKKIKIAITGGPSGGKTTLIEALQKDLSGKLAVVPEAASILYRGGFPRKPTENNRIHAQRAIYYTQKELEDLTSETANTNLIVCDRGSLDSIAYWPKDEAHFFAHLKLDKNAELARYDWVIHLDTASQDAFDTSNPLRTESFQEAMLLNDAIKKAWADHPRRVLIAHENNFLNKIGKAKKLITDLLSQIDTTDF